MLDSESVKLIDQSLFPPQESIIAGFIYPLRRDSHAAERVAARLDTAAALLTSAALTAAVRSANR